MDLALWEEEEVLWATSTTGEDFKCVHVDFARLLVAEIDRLQRERDALIADVESLQKALLKAEGIEQ